MALPEQQPEIPPDQQVIEVPDQPEIPAAVEAAGVHSAQPTMQPVQGDDNQPIAQPVPAPAPSGPSIKIPATGEQQLEALSKGSINDSKTWFGVYWLYKIRKAVKDGLQVIFGGGK
jgi:hypothetical protein